MTTESFGSRTGVPGWESVDSRKQRRVSAQLCSGGELIEMFMIIRWWTIQTWMRRSNQEPALRLLDFDLRDSVENGLSGCPAGVKRSIPLRLRTHDKQ